MITTITTLLLVFLVVLAAQLNILVLVITNIKREELEEKHVQQKQFASPLDSINSWEWEPPKEKQNGI